MSGICFKAILVDSDAYLLELARYIVLNPVRANMVRRPAAWPWSSYGASMGAVLAEPFLAVDGLLARFAKRRETARERYARFVAEGIGAPSPWPQVHGQVFLGDEAFVATMQAKLEHPQRQDVQIPKAQRRTPAPTLAHIAKGAKDRDTAIVAAHGTGAYSYQEIGDHFGVHFTTVGRIVRKAQ